MRATPDAAARRDADAFAEQIGRQFRRRSGGAANGVVAVGSEPWTDLAKVTVWTAHTKAPFAVPFRLLGAWDLRVRWRWMPLRSGGSALLDASISLNVELPAVGASDPWPGAAFPRAKLFCLIRYDYEAHGGRPGRHLNIWQAASLEDKAHWRLPGPELPTATPWNAQQVVDYLMSPELEADLRNGSWPDA